MRVVAIGVIGLAALCLTVMVAGGEPATQELLFWAPYGAGSPEQAAETMEEFGRYLESAAGWSPGAVTTSYLNTVEDGVARLAEESPGFLVVTVPVFLRHAEEQGWKPLLTLVTDSAEAQRYSLYGPMGSTLDSLAGAPLAGDSAYDPAFVASVVLGRDGGDLPFELQPTSRPLSAVRKASQGERLLVLLDEAQRQALAALPSGSELALLAESPWMPAGIVVASPSVPEEQVEAATAALLGAEKDSAAAELLGTMKIKRFEPVAPEALASLGRSYETARPSGGESVGEPGKRDGTGRGQ